MNQRPKGPIIDIHAHVFPGKIAEKAVQSIGDYYSLPMRGPGTVEGLLESGQAHGVVKYVINSTATRPDQVQAINAFIAQTCARDKRLIGFGTLHPGQQDLRETLECFPTLGLAGLKLHPDFQDFAIDDPCMVPIYALAEGRLPVLIHMGDENHDRSSPARLARVLDRFPKLIVIAAHLGGYLMWEESLKLLAGRNLYFDTSSSLEFMAPGLTLEIIRKHGAHRVLFGTDYPMWMHEDELERFFALDLTAEEQERILWKNAAELLGIELPSA